MVDWDILVSVKIGLVTMAVVVIIFKQKHLVVLHPKLHIIHASCLALSTAKSITVVNQWLLLGNVKLV